MRESQLNITNCNFINNSGNLGIIKKYRKKCNIDNSLFANNYNTNTKNINISKGIIVNSSTVNIKNHLNSKIIKECMEEQL